MDNLASTILDALNAYRAMPAIVAAFVMLAALSLMEPDNENNNDEE